MQLFIFFVLTYFVIFEHNHYYIIAIYSNNISLMNTSTKIITTNQITHINSLIILSFCLSSLIILCLYAIFHNSQSRGVSLEKINVKPIHIDTENSLENKREQDLLTMNDDSNKSSLSVQQASPVSWGTTLSNKSF